MSEGLVFIKDVTVPKTSIVPFLSGPPFVPCVESGFLRLIKFSLPFVKLGYAIVFWFDSINSFGENFLDKRSLNGTNLFLLIVIISFSWPKDVLLKSWFISPLLNEIKSELTDMFGNKLPLKWNMFCLSLPNLCEKYF